jgi:hypothetical protein
MYEKGVWQKITIISLAPVIRATQQNRAKYK